MKTETPAQASLMTYRQVAEYLTVDTRTVQRLTASRQLRCVKIGRTVRFRPADIEAYIRANLTEAA